MAKLNSRNLLTVPKSLIKSSDTDFSGDVRLFFRGKELFFDNVTFKNCPRNYLGKITFDERNRFYVPKLARTILNLYPGDNIIFYVYNGKVTFKKVFFVPENR